MYARVFARRSSSPPPRSCAQAAGISRKAALGIGISVDHRRKNRSEEAFQQNVARLKLYKSKLVVFPRNPTSKRGECLRVCVCRCVVYLRSCCACVCACIYVRVSLLSKAAPLRSQEDRLVGRGAQGRFAEPQPHRVGSAQPQQPPQGARHHQGGARAQRAGHSPQGPHRRQALGCVGEARLCGECALRGRLGLGCRVPLIMPYMFVVWWFVSRRLALVPARTRCVLVARRHAREAAAREEGRQAGRGEEGRVSAAADQGRSLALCLQWRPTRARGFCVRRGRRCGRGGGVCGVCSGRRGARPRPALWVDVVVAVVGEYKGTLAHSCSGVRKSAE